MYEKRKCCKEEKKKEKVMEVKEIKLGGGRDEGEYEVKVGRVIGFVEEGDKGKMRVGLGGGEMGEEEMGMEVVNGVKEDLEEVGVVEWLGRKMEGGEMMMVVGGKKKE